MAPVVVAATLASAAATAVGLTAEDQIAVAAVVVATDGSVPIVAAGPKQTQAWGHGLGTGMCT